MWDVAYYGAASVCARFPAFELRLQVFCPLWTPYTHQPLCIRRAQVSNGAGTQCVRLSVVKKTTAALVLWCAILAAHRSVLCSAQNSAAGEGILARSST